MNQAIQRFSEQFSVEIHLLRKCLKSWIYEGVILFSTCLDRLKMHVCFSSFKFSPGLDCRVGHFVEKKGPSLKMAHRGPS